METGPSSQKAQLDVPDVVTDGAASAREYVVDKWRIQLIDDGAACKLEYRSGTGERRGLALDVTPPCYLLLWQSSILRKANAERAPIGSDGDPMAWRYKGDGAETLAIAVIGDPVSEMLRTGERFRTAERQGYHCAGSAQGVLFRKDIVKTVTKRNQVGIFCVEIPIEEASFWLTTHEARK
jgi:hypothetical protein